jgi:hypothetical protein
MNPLVIVVILAVVGGVIYFLMSDPVVSDAKPLVTAVQSGMVKTSTSYQLPLAFNQPEGLTYSYSMWILIKDFTTGYGTRRTILSKGDSPGIYLDSTSNSIVVAVKTYGTTETILIPNIPALKWIHLAVVVNQYSVDVYINGTLRQHHSLTQLPDQTSDPVVVGPGWNGLIGSAIYYPRSLSYAEINEMASADPPPDDGPVIGKKNYFDITWYTGRLNSS